MFSNIYRSIVIGMRALRTVVENAKARGLVSCRCALEVLGPFVWRGEVASKGEFGLRGQPNSAECS